MSLLRYLGIVSITILCILVIGFKTFAQGFDHNWLVKRTVGSPGVLVTFDADNDSLLLGTFENDHRFFENYMFSDTSGDPLFFSTGVQLWNDFGDLMEGGDSMFVNIGLAEEWYTKTEWIPYVPLEWFSVDIVPLRRGDYLHLHYSHRDRLSTGFNISLTDTAGWDQIQYCEDAYSSYIRKRDDVYYVEQDTKLLRMIEGKFVTSSNTWIKHANGVDWWLYLPHIENDSVRVVMLDGLDGHKLLEDTYPFSPSNQIATPSSDMFPSPDGTSMARFLYRNGGHPTDGFFQSLLEFYDIDRCTGMPSLRWYQWFDNYRQHGVTADLEWSPSGRYVYIAYNKIIMQLDMERDDFWGHRDTIATWVEGDPDWPTAIMFSDLHTLPNGEMLVSGFGATPFMHLIRDPDQGGAACDFRYKYYATQGEAGPIQERPLVGGIPGWVPFRMGPLEGAPCITSTEELPGQVVEEISVSPSPVVDRIYLSCNSDLHEREVIVHDYQGRMVYRGVYDDALDISRLSPGTYLVHGVDILAVGRFVKI